MAFTGILFPEGKSARIWDHAGECFLDLGLDRFWEAVQARRPGRDLAPFFRAFPDGLEAALWRQDVFRDLGRPPAAEAVRTFTRRMAEARAALDFSAQSSYPVERSRWILAAALTYAGAVRLLAQDLDAAHPRSAGLRSLLAWLEAYTASEGFRTMEAEARKVEAGLKAVSFSLSVRRGQVTAWPDDGRMGLHAEIEGLFARFRTGTAHDYTVRFDAPPGMNHIEAQITDRAAKVHPEPFADLERFRAEHADFLAPVLDAFELQIQFYLAVLEQTEALGRSGLGFCLPGLSDTDKTEEVHGGFELAVALAPTAGKRGAKAGAPDEEGLVRNGFELRPGERLMAVTGPNQGGKTTFARMVGQLHVLAALGCPVPAAKARLFLCDRVFTHFERGERVENLRSKLEDDLKRVRDVLEAAGGRSLIVLNEIFSSTAADDALALGRAVLGRVRSLDALCVCVTFLDELSRFDARTVSLVAGVDPADPARRTFRLERRPADGLAHALALARKHGVTGEQLLARLAP